MVKTSFGFGEAETYTATAGASTLYALDFARDNAGRITNKLEVTGVYDDQDRLLSLTGSGPVLPTTYTYSANGELQTKTVGSDTVTYSYDVRGGLRDVTLANGTVVSYVVDATGRRVGRKVNGVFTQKWLYQDSLKPIAELNAAGAVVSRFVYAGKANVPEYMVRGGTTYRLITDHLGSVRLVVNASNGSIVQRLDYDEFGRVLVDTNPSFQPFGYAGGLYDPLTGLVRFGARDYDAESGRWTSKDPIGEHGGLNVYAYVGNEPVNYADPVGRYGFSTKFWADLSVTGSWWQKAVAWPLGVISAAVPDAVGVSVNGTAGFVGGGTVGVQHVWFGDSQADYSFAGYTKGPHGCPPGFVTPQVGIGISLSIAWSDEYNPGPDTWTGRFSEASLYEGVISETGFWSDHWQGIGIGAGVGPVPVGASYFDTVDYQFIGEPKAYTK